MMPRSDRRLPTALSLCAVVALVIAVFSSMVLEAQPSKAIAVGVAPTDLRQSDWGVEQHAASQRAAAQRAPACWSARRLRIIDAAGARPLSDSSIIFRHAGVTETVQADIDGYASWPAEIDGCAQIDVSCKGHVTLSGELAPPVLDEFVTIALEPAGVVRVTVLDRHGEPAANVFVALLLPLAGQGGWAREWSAIRRQGTPAHDGLGMMELRPDAQGIIHASQDVVRLTPTIAISSRLLAALPCDRKTDQNGVVEWRGVAPSAGYRFGILGANHAQVEPAFERSRLSVTARGVSVGAGAPLNLSGPFDVMPEKATEGLAMLEGAGSVFGSIVGAERDNVRVKLVRIRQAGGGDIERVTVFDAESVQPALDGAFRFADVRPGIFVLRACWLRGERDVYFVSTTFRLEDSAELDLGMLSPMDGAVATVRVGLQVGADEVAPVEVFANPRAAGAILTIAFQPASQNAADAVTEYAQVAFGSELVLHGIPSGRLQLQARPAMDFVMLPEVQRVDASEVVERQVFELAGTLSVRMPVVRGIRCALDVCDSRGVQLSVTQVQVRNRMSGRVDSIEVQSDGLLPLARSFFVIEPGLYDAWVSRSGGNGWLAKAFEIDARVPSPAAISVRLEEAASICGSVVDERGAPSPNRLVRWSPRLLAEAGIWMHSTRSAADGSFVVHGIPPGVVLRRCGAATPIGPLGPGQSCSVETVVAVVDPFEK